MKLLSGLCFLLFMLSMYIPFKPAHAEDNNAEIEKLSAEIKPLGLLIYSARSENGTWDIFTSRPDGSGAKNITNTPDFEEAAPRLRNDGKKMLYRRLAKGTVINHDRWGFQGELICANPDGTDRKILGKDGDYPWASWSPDGSEIICLNLKGIQFIDLAKLTVTRRMPRKGIYQQLFLSPDGAWFCGVANTLGMWTVVRMSAETGELNAVQKFQNCTPDWFPDSEHIIYSSRPAGQKANDEYGWTQLWAAHGAGKEHRLLYAEEGYHIYGGALSPDGNYLLFAKSPEDGAGAELSGAPMCIMRMADTPSIKGKSSEMRALHPDAKDSPVLELTNGWEPTWLYTDTGE